MKRPRDDPDVVLRVGPDRVEIRAFSQLLAVSSDFFDAALGNGMREQRTMCVELPDQDPDTVRLLLDCLSPGSGVVLTRKNVLALVPLFSQLQCTVALRQADQLCANELYRDLMSPVRMMQFATEHSLPETRRRAMEIVRGHPANHMSELAALFEDTRGADLFAALWPDLRRVLLSPKQQKDGVMSEPPDWEHCRIVWPALCYAAQRGHVLQGLAYAMDVKFPTGDFVRADVRKREGTVVDGRYVAKLVASAVEQFLPGHEQLLPDGETDTAYGRDLAEKSCKLPLARKPTSHAFH